MIEFKKCTWITLYGVLSFVGVVTATKLWFLPTLIIFTVVWIIGMFFWVNWVAADEKPIENKEYQ